MVRRANKGGGPPPKKPRAPKAPKAPKAPNKNRPPTESKQTKIPGTNIPELEEASEEFRRDRNEWQAAQKVMMASKQKLIDKIDELVKAGKLRPDGDAKQRVYTYEVDEDGEDTSLDLFWGRPEVDVAVRKAKKDKAA